MINRGYYSRYAAIRKALELFLESTATEASQGFQILSLGAGFDTTWFQLKQDGRAPAKYIELDFKEVTRRKVASIKAHDLLKNLLAPNSLAENCTETGEVLSEEYSVLPVDLRDLEGLEAVLSKAGFRPSMPTFILAECVLVYLEPQHSQALVAWLGARCCTAAMVVYEQIKPDDAFGRQMLRNLESRGCPLKGLPATPTLDAHCDRFVAGGWQRSAALDMDRIYLHWLDAADKTRVERLEVFDEYEEWHMIQEHYCLVFGVNDSAGLLQKVEFGSIPGVVVKVPKGA